MTLRRTYGTPQTLGRIQNGTSRRLGPGFASDMGRYGDLLVPEVYPWPYGSDETGVSYPAGMVGVLCGRSYRPAGFASVSELNASLIGVPGTLPGGYVQRGRDAQRGTATGSGNVAPFLYMASESVVGAFYIYWKNGWSYSEQPYYRDAGTGLVKPTWFPTVIGNRAYKYSAGDVDWIVSPNSNPTPTFDDIFGTPAGYAVVIPQTYGAAVSPGWRSVKLKLTFQKDNSAPARGMLSKIRVAKTDADVLPSSMNAMQQQYGYTQISLNSITEADLTYVGPYLLAPPGFDLYEYNVNLGSFLFTKPTMSRLIVGVAQFDRTGTTLSGSEYSLIDHIVGETAPDERGLLTCSPRCDVPLWHTATSAGLVAPGGV